MSSVVVKRLSAALRRPFIQQQKQLNALSIFRPFASTTSLRNANTPNQESPPTSSSLLGKLSEDTKADTLGFNPEELTANITEASLNPYGAGPCHHLHVYAHKHNTHLTLTRPNGGPMLSLSCGSIGFRKSHRGGYDPAHQLSAYLMAKIQERGFLMDIKRLEVVLRGFGPGREAFTKVLLGNEGSKIREKVVRVTDATRLKFGGTRSPKVNQLPEGSGIFRITPTAEQSSGLSAKSVSKLHERRSPSAGPPNVVWMPPLNPFLRAFFRSVLPSQCIPIQNHILLVPITESLVNARDRDSNTLYVDLVHSEEFLGSHVLRITGSNSTKDAFAGPREGRGKPRQMTTANGRTVAIRESMVYSNKGFKNLNQALLLSDILYYAPGKESQPWLIYYISKPLLGTYDPAGIVQAVLPGNSRQVLEASKSPSPGDNNSPDFPRKELQSFGELLANFPMIARQMQPGLERLFREFGKELGKPLPPPPSRSSFTDPENETGDADEAASIRSMSSATQKALPFNSSKYFEDDEDLMRRALETAVTAAIDLFRLVDRQQLSLVGATTNLTGPMVEQLIERYVTEQVHDSLLFPRICGCRKAEDAELDIRIRQMENIDVSQVGIPIEGGRKGKDELIHRLGKGVEEFRNMVDAKCPQEMLKILLATIKTVTLKYISDKKVEDASEKETSVLTINADILVSLLLVVIVRSQVRHLQARLSYMQHFIYIDDVESGESGYALSTFEAVLMYLRNDSGGLRKASAINRRLWSATKSGKISEMKAILEPDSQDSTSIDSSDKSGQMKLTQLSSSKDEDEQDPSDVNSGMNGSISAHTTQEPIEIPTIPETPRLAHVFPFQTWVDNSPPKAQPRVRKKVSMDVGSVSESSNFSFLSRSTTFGSLASYVEGDISIGILTKTQDPAGDSIPMMAVEACQPEALKYLFSLEDYYPVENILEDVNSDGTTLLSAAVQLAHANIVDILLDFISEAAAPNDVTAYFAKADARGRTVAHYLFSVPWLMSRIGTALPWRQRDKHGQTPLFALCRSYDHPDYNAMVNQSLTVAQEAQGDGKPLRLDDHVDAKGNTLLHVVSDPQILYRMLRECDCDPNATNDKRFTPLMMASKYGRVDLVRVLFADPRVDAHLREARGLTAVELAKDDEVRNRIDDLILFSHPPSSTVDSSGRITAVVRSVFVEDASIRFIIKSGAPNPTSPSESDQPRKVISYTVTTCRRGLADFENLVKFLRIEHPASYIPDVPAFRSPLQIYSKPSRAVLHEVQERLDKLIKILIAHPTFATHELLWEFFLVPEVQTEMINERSHRKAAALAERIADDYQPVTVEGTRDVEQIVGHAQDAVRAVSNHTRAIIRRGHRLHNASTDFAEAVSMCTYAISSLQAPTNALPQPHVDAINRFAACYSSSSLDSSPLTQYLSALTSSHTTTIAMLESLSRPGRLISDLNSATRALSRSRSTLASSSVPRKFNFPGLEESRQRSIREQEQKIAELNAEIEQVGKEIAWNKDVVVGELAGWTDWRGKLGKEAIREFVRTTLVREKERGKRMERCLKALRG